MIQYSITDSIAARPLRLLKIVLLLLVTGCQHAPDSYVATREHDSAHSPWSARPEVYSAEAKGADGVTKKQKMVQLAGSLITHGQWQEGRALLAKTGTLPPELHDERQLLLAKTSLVSNRARAALEQLAQINAAGKLDNFYRIQYYRLQAAAFENLNKYDEAMSARLALQPLLTDDGDALANLKLVWFNLMQMTPEEIALAEERPGLGDEGRGWYRLAHIARSTDPDNFSRQLHTWQQQYKGHPAERIITPNDAENLRVAQHIALLLPLTGQLSGPGNAILDGFMQAALATGNTPKIDTWNTDAADIEALYRDAVASGADYIIGPLEKKGAQKIASMKHPVPTLLLNSTGTVDKNLWNFGLSPVVEARQLAGKARTMGYSRALVIVPEGEWAADIASAFTEQFQHEGGIIVDSLQYNLRDNPDPAVKTLLDVKKSEARIAVMKKLLGRKLETVAARRQDFDMVFVLAWPQKGRQLIPLLRYYYAGDTAIFATSNIYAGNPNPLGDRDLDGVIFCDVPGMLTADASPEATRNWPEELNSYARLYALGQESWQLARQLRQLMVLPAIAGAKSTLYLNPEQQIAHRMDFAKFVNGVPVKL